MEIFSIDKIFLFILFFVPGFISMKVYQLMIASEYSKFSESINEAIGFSSINFAALSWLIIIIHKDNFYQNHLISYLLICLFIIFVAPIIWPILYVNLAKSKILRKYILNPIKTPWDYYFGKSKSAWVIVNLNSGEKIGGVYSNNSFASAFPYKNQIFLEELWIITKQGKFLKKKERTNGTIIFCSDVKSIEFYAN